MTTVRRPSTACPYCSKENDAATPAGTDAEAVPGPGDVSVCFYCGGIAVFTETGLRKPTDAERADLLEDPLVIEAAGRVLAYRSEHP